MPTKVVNFEALKRMKLWSPEKNVLGNGHKSAFPFPRENSLNKWILNVNQIVIWPWGISFFAGAFKQAALCYICTEAKVEAQEAAARVGKAHSQQRGYLPIRLGTPPTTSPYENWPFRAILESFLSNPCHSRFEIIVLQLRFHILAPILLVNFPGFPRPHPPGLFFGELPIFAALRGQLQQQSLYIMWKVSIP